MAETAEDLSWAVDGPPVGLWATSTGSADVLMQETLSLRPDGTGYLRSRSVLQGEEILPVMWFHEGPGVLKLSVLLPGDDPQADPEWETVRYTVASARSDLGERPVLKNTVDHMFWMLTAPIALVSRTAD